MKFARILKELRKRDGYTQEHLAEMLKVSKSTISMYEQGERMPIYETMEAIADIFNVDMDVLYGRAASSPNECATGIDIEKADASCLMLPDLLAKKGVRIPVYGNVAAGIPIEAITDIEDYEEISIEMASKGDYAALKIHGDSMEPRMTNGDVVIVRIQETIENGEIAIVMINGDEATCKKVMKTNDGIMLISTNSKYEPMFYSNKQIEELPIRIFGKVVELRAKF